MHIHVHATYITCITYAHTCKQYNSQLIKVHDSIKGIKKNKKKVMATKQTHYRKARFGRSLQRRKRHKPNWRKG